MYILYIKFVCLYKFQLDTPSIASIVPVLLSQAAMLPNPVYRFLIFSLHLIPVFRLAKVLTQRNFSRFLYILSFDIPNNSSFPTFRFSTQNTDSDSFIFVYWIRINTTENQNKNDK